jgi:hypothetical protein
MSSKKPFTEMTDMHIMFGHAFGLKVAAYYYHDCLVTRFLMEKCF